MTGNQGDKTGGAAQAVGVLGDIEQRYRVLLEAVSDVFWIMDLEGNFTDVSPSVERLLGYLPEEFLQLGLKGVLTPDCYENVRTLIDRTSELARSGRLERSRSGRLVLDEQHVHSNGDVIWTEVTNHFLFDEQDRPIGYAGVIRDVTERRQAEARIRALTEELEQRVLERTEAVRQKDQQLRHAQKMEAVGRLAGGVAHDFNNLLVVIQSYTSMLLAGGSEPDEIQECLGEIAAAAERGAELTSQLLAISRKQPLRQRTVYLGELIRNNAGMLRRLLGEDVDLVVDVQPELDAVLADAQSLQQVLLNLAVNARDAMPEGGKLTLRAAPADPTVSYAQRFGPDASGPYVVLSVSDTGFGMDTETRSHIFEPFFTTKERGKGTGLGLSTVYGIVKQSGGELEVHSEPGKGSTFDVYLPVSLNKTPTTGDVPIVKVRRRASQTILLVEDEEQVRVVARRILERDGYRVLDAAAPEDAVRLCKEHPGPIHLLLTDVVMPRMNGIQLSEVAGELRPDLRVILMSGYPDAPRGDEASSDRPFLAKPFTPEALKQIVRVVLARAAPNQPY